MSRLAILRVHSEESGFIQGFFEPPPALAARVAADSIVVDLGVGKQRFQDGRVLFVDREVGWAGGTYETLFRYDADGPAPACAANPPASGDGGGGGDDDGGCSCSLANAGAGGGLALPIMITILIICIWLRRAVG